MTRTKWFILFLVAQIGILSLMGVSWFLTGTYGKEIRLQTEIVDPNDIFYGDYLALSYKVNEVPISLWNGDDVKRYKNKNVYVVFVPKKGLWEVNGVFPKRQNAPQNGVVVKALLKSIGDKSTLRLVYGTEKYYIPHKSGTRWEKVKGPLVAVIKVSSWGQLRVMGLEKK